MRWSREYPSSGRGVVRGYPFISSNAPVSIPKLAMNINDPMVCVAWERENSEQELNKDRIHNAQTRGGLVSGVLPKRGGVGVTLLSTFVTAPNTTNFI